MGWLNFGHPLNLAKHTVWMDDTCTARLISGPRTSFRIHGVHLLDYAPFSLSRGERGGRIPFVDSLSCTVRIPTQLSLKTLSRHTRPFFIFLF